MAMAARFQPGSRDNPNPDYDREQYAFWLDRSREALRDAAPYYAPKLHAVAVQTVPSIEDKDDGRIDPRQLLFEMYMQMRRRGGISDEGKIVDALRDEVEALQAEVAALKALAGKTPEHSDIATMVQRVPASAAGNVVPLPRPNPPAVPAYDYNTQRGWRDHVLPDGSIRT
jgi:hypothetical protein